MTNSGFFVYRLYLVADIADDGMDLSTISRINRWQFTGKPLLCHAASGKYKSGISIWKDQSESQRYFDNFPWLERTVIGHIYIGTGIVFMDAERIVSGSAARNQ